MFVLYQFYIFEVNQKCLRILWHCPLLIQNDSRINGLTHHQIKLLLKDEGHCSDLTKKYDFWHIPVNTTQSMYLSRMRYS